MAATAPSGAVFFTRTPASSHCPTEERTLSLYKFLDTYWRRHFIETSAIYYEEVVAQLEAERRPRGGSDRPASIFIAPSGRFLTASLRQVRQPLYRRSIGRWRCSARHLSRLLNRSSGSASKQAGIPRRILYTKFLALLPNPRC
jgi:hypothetical protein